MHAMTFNAMTLRTLMDLCKGELRLLRLTETLILILINVENIFAMHDTIKLIRGDRKGNYIVTKCFLSPLINLIVPAEQKLFFFF